MDEIIEEPLDCLSDVLGTLSDFGTEVILEAKEYFDFNAKDRVFLLEEGEILIMTPPDPDSGRSRRHVLKAGEPYGALEAIASRVAVFDCTAQSRAKLRVFDGAKMRSHANTCGVFARTILRLFFKRVFDSIDPEKDKKASIAFEDDFIYANRDDLRNMEVSSETLIFKAKAPADKMYFIEKGVVSLISESNRVIAELGTGEIFGEAVLLGDTFRPFAAMVERDADIWAIEANFARRELQQEHPLAQLAVLLGILQYRVSNQLKGLR